RALIWDVVVRPNAELQGAFVAVIGHAPGVIGFRILAPIALIPHDLNISIIEQSSLGVVNVHARAAIAHQNSARRRNALWPAEIKKHARDVEEMDAEVAGLSVAEFAGVTPAAGVNAGVIFTPGRRADIHLPIHG